MKDLDIISKFGVRGDGGVLNEEETVKKFRSFVTSYSKGEESSIASVRDAVEKVLTAHKGVNINLQYLITCALPLVGANHTNNIALTAKIREYVKANSGERGERRFQNTKRNGIKRWSDVPETDEKA